MLLLTGRVGVLGLVLVSADSLPELFLESRSSDAGPQYPTDELERKLDQQFAISGPKVDKAIEAGNHGKLLVVIDFDRTITRGNGLSSHDVLQLSEETDAKRQKDSKKYHAIEDDPAMTIAEKIPFIEEWYGKTHALIAQNQITKEKMIEQCNASKIRLREGVPEFFRLCKERDIPVIVMSAGIADILQAILRRDAPEAQYQVISNLFTFSDTDPSYITGTRAPLIHPYNKSWESVPDSIRQAMEGKTHALVIGDSVGDATMAHGSSLQTYKIGFENTGDLKWKPIYEKTFDTVLYGPDHDFTPINEMVDRINTSKSENLSSGIRLFLSLYLVLYV